MPIRQNQHPSVEIREIDKSQYSPAIVGTVFLVQGFSQQGVPHYPLEIATTQEFVDVFGKPTNEAERYFYATAEQVINNNGKLLASKLPYDNVKDNQYNVLPLIVDAAIPFSELSGLVDGPGATSGDFMDISGNVNLSTSSISAIYDHGITQFRKCVFNDKVAITHDNYMALLEQGAYGVDDDASDLDLSSTFVIVDQAKSQIYDQDIMPGGKFVVLVDFIDAVVSQRLFNTTGDFLSLINDIKYDNAQPLIPTTTDNFVQTVNDRADRSSFSKTLSQYFPNIVLNGTDLDTTYKNYVVLCVVSTKSDVNFNGKLNLKVEEIHIGSLADGDKDKVTGQSIFLPDVVNASSDSIKMFKNFGKTVTYDDVTTNIIADDYAEYLGFTTAQSNNLIDGSLLASKLEITFDKLSDIDDKQIDVVVESGLGTIAQFTSDDGGPCEFDPKYDTNSTVVNSPDSTAIWKLVANSLITFCSKTRKDCMAILDTPRNLEVKGNTPRLKKIDNGKTFSNTIAPLLRYVTGLNSSYAALYSNWRKQNDLTTGLPFWAPPSATTAGVYARNDTVGEIWDAPAGLNRGSLNPVSALAYQPTGSDADLIYTKNINFAKSYPTNGFILEGQKTCQNLNSALDRVNVRRTMLRLERFVAQTARYFVYEPNNVNTRTRLVNALTPTFNSFKQSQGITDYLIRCDATTNPPDVIDRNELKIAIYVKPVKTVEFLLVDFIITRQDSSFNEIV